MGEAARLEVRERYEGAGLPPPEDPETGEVLLHTEWVGWLYCEAEQGAFDWETGDVECPHCGREFRVLEAGEAAG